MAKLLVVAASGALVGASHCAGTADPVISGDTCYQGSAGALGLKETVLVKIHSFSSGSGSVDLIGSGIEGFTCKDKTFKKSGQDLSIDFGSDGCFPSEITLDSVKYCSDSDTIAVTVKDNSVPIPISAVAPKVSCPSSVADAKDLMFSEFKSTYNKVYNGDEHDRRVIFEQNVQYIISENRKAGGEFYFGVNQFADLTQAEFKSMYLNGLNPVTSVDAPYLGRHEFRGETLPDSVDWTAKGAVTPVKNQGQCGSCWSFSTTGSLEGAAQLATGSLPSLSEQQFVDCDKVDQGCNGGLMDNAFKFAKDNDLCTEESYAYTGSDGTCKSSCTVGLKKGSVTGYKDVAHTTQDLMSAVAQQPVSIAVDAMTVFQLYHSGVMSWPCGASLDHGVLAVGYGTSDGTDYWKVKNSWGASWGMDGYILLKRGKGGDGECGLLKSPSYPIVTSTVAV